MTIWIKFANPRGCTDLIIIDLMIHYGYNLINNSSSTTLLFFVFFKQSCNMWSMGVIVYIMLCGHPPFYSETPTKQITKNMKRKIKQLTFKYFTFCFLLRAVICGRWALLSTSCCAVTLLFIWKPQPSKSRRT